MHVPHRNAPLCPEGRPRLIRRCRDRPIAHVAAETGIARSYTSNWGNRFRRCGELGLVDRSSAPEHRPPSINADIVARVEALRCIEKWSASRITFELGGEGVSRSRRTVSSTP
ncbi:helix-turn-helix domain-containing protein [Streptomyces umbrinus]|uniref:helix-turn-helix domain-containing protein n=1 Tax=Streptomyces umbrinus TaxID=67370 RepID=UPI001BC9DC5C|nr:leucine zipper domain-containing protein [Streptomyces umbrinus]MCX4554638.1 leucine zipper domain-containing protein [Streptomyces phaeochromogenes]